MDGKSDEPVTAKAAVTVSSDVEETQLGKGKRTVKLIHKAFVEKCDKLQNERKDKLNKVKNVRKVTKEHMHKSNGKQVKCVLEEFFVCVKKQKLHMIPWSH